jgi:hypothetical protein
MSRLLRYQDVLEVIERLVEVGRARGEPVREPLVLVGGSAMAAHGIREESVDVDLFAPHVSPDVAHAAERGLAQRFGDTFRLDVTGVANLWGPIMINDIPDAPAVPDRPGGLTLRALSIEDLFLLKLQAGRDKDRDDLPLLANRTSPEALIHRFGQLAAWHGNRAELMRFADDLVRELERRFGLDPRHAIASLQVPDYVRAALTEAWNGGDHD